MRNFILAIGGIYAALMLFMFGIGQFSSAGEAVAVEVDEVSETIVLEAEPSSEMISVALPAVSTDDTLVNSDIDETISTAESDLVVDQVEQRDDEEEESPEVPEIYIEFINEEILALSRFQERLSDPVGLTRDSDALALFFAQYASSRSYLVEIHADLPPEVQPLNLAFIETYASAQDVAGSMMGAQLADYSTRSLNRIERNVNKFSESWGIMVEELRASEILE